MRTMIRFGNILSWMTIAIITVIYFPPLSAKTVKTSTSRKSWTIPKIWGYGWLFKCFRSGRKTGLLTHYFLQRMITQTSIFLSSFLSEFYCFSLLCVCVWGGVVCSGLWWVFMTSKSFSIRFASWPELLILTMISWVWFPVFPWTFYF